MNNNIMHGDEYVGIPTSSTTAITDVDQTDKLGCAVALCTAVGNDNNNAGLVLIGIDLTQRPFGVIVQGGYAGGTGTPKRTTVCTFAGGSIVKCKLAAVPGTVTPGTELVCYSDGTFRADPATGARWVVATVLWTGTAAAGAAGNLVEAQLHQPIYYSS
jgi:hypothetical protein